MRFFRFLFGWWGSPVTAPPEPPTGTDPISPTYTVYARGTAVDSAGRIGMANASEAGLISVEDSRLSGRIGIATPQE